MNLDRHEVMNRIREAVDKAGSQSEIARQLGISRAYMSDMMLGKREPSKALLNYCWIEREVIYKIIYKTKRHKAGE